MSATIVPFDAAWTDGHKRAHPKGEAAAAARDTHRKPRVLSTEVDRALARRATDASAIGDLQWRRRAKVAGRIRSLRVGYNRVFGYYLEVTRPNLKSVPADYQRRQSLVSSERS